MIETKDEENDMTDGSMTAQEVAPAEEFELELELENHFPSELAEPIWSVVTYETVAAGGLTYDEAAKLADRLKDEKVSGLCIITDDAAERISSHE